MTSAAPPPADSEVRLQAAVAVTDESADPYADPPCTD
jgi:hypothetical protein